MDDFAARRTGDTGKDDCERLQELLPAYMIGATDAEETRLVESLLESCPEVAAELTEYESLTGAMLFAAPPKEPPAGLHDRIMAAAVGGKTSPSRKTAPLTVATRPPAKPQPVRAVSYSRGLAAFALAAAALLIATNAFWLFRFTQLDNDRRQMLDLLRGQGAVLAAVSSGSSHRIQLASTANNAEIATVLWSPQSSVALLYSRDLPALQPGRTYQLWLIRGQTPISAGLFQPDAQGEATYLFTPTEAIDQVDAVGISDEPASGSPAPSTAPIAVGAVQA